MQFTLGGQLMSGTTRTVQSVAPAFRATVVGYRVTSGGHAYFFGCGVQGMLVLQTTSRSASHSEPTFVTFHEAAPSGGSAGADEVVADGAALAVVSGC